jgi:hypothetical protein
MAWLALRVVLGAVLGVLSSVAVVRVVDKTLLRSTDSSGVDGLFMVVVTFVPAGLGAGAVAGARGSATALLVVAGVGALALLVALVTLLRNRYADKRQGLRSFTRWLLLYVLGPTLLCGVALGRLLP